MIAWLVVMLLLWVLWRVALWANSLPEEGGGDDHDLPCVYCGQPAPNGLTCKSHT